MRTTIHEGDDFLPTHAAGGDNSLVGRSLGGYRIERLVSKGGMGELYLAHDPALDKRFAVKGVRGRDEADEDLRKRFVREARLACRIDDPHVVPILKLGTEGNLDYSVMPFVEGTDLDRTIRERTRPLPPKKAVGLIVQAARGLAAIHAAGIVHRDVKPSNILVGEDGRVRVADLGLAVDTRDRGSLTATGSFVGTPQFMSPEQARGEDVDARTDVYSLGLTLWFLLTGRQPFEAPTVLDVLNAQCSRPLPDPATIHAGAKGAPIDLLERMTAKAAGDRPASMDQVVEELDHWMRTAGPGTTGARRGRRPGSSLLVAGIAAVAAVAASVPLVLWATGALDGEPKPVAVPEPRPEPPPTGSGDPPAVDPKVPVTRAKLEVSLSDALGGARVRLLEDAPDRLRIEATWLAGEPEFLGLVESGGYDLQGEGGEFVARRQAGAQEPIGSFFLGEWKAPLEVSVEVRGIPDEETSFWMHYFQTGEHRYAAVVFPGAELFHTRCDDDGKDTDSTRSIDRDLDEWTRWTISVGEDGRHRIAFGPDEPLEVSDARYSSGLLTFYWTDAPEFRIRNLVVRGCVDDQTLRALRGR